MDSLLSKLAVARRLNLPQLGIVAHLLLAFVAVAALALSANLIAEHGTLIVRTRDVVAAPAVPLAAPPLVVEQASLAPAPGAPPASQGVSETEKLVASIDHYGSAALDRASEATPAITEQMRAAAEELKSATAAYVQLSTTTTGDRRFAKTLASRISAQQALASELVRKVDLREQQWRALWAQFEDLDGRTKGVLDSSWKIFGRVITRQSIIQLGRRLDEMRRDLGTLSTPQSYRDADLAALSAEEAALKAAFAEAAPSLARSQGAQWAKQMQDDFAALSNAQAQLLRADGEIRTARSEFPAGIIQLKALARTVEAHRRVAAEVALRSAQSRPLVNQTRKVLAPASKQAPGSLLPTGNAAGGLALPAAIAAPAVSHTESHREVDSGLQRLLGWVSAIALLTLAALCLSIALKIVMPVRRLMHATRKVAGGEANVRVSTGGIRELDALAHSFNEMAERVQAAQQLTLDHQRQLEAKVRERTSQLQHLAEHDPLTELPNRRQLFSELEVALQEAQAHGHHVGVLVLDLDNFKNINDSMGHAFGDQLLQAIARRLGEISGAFGFSARLGGDEFTVVYERAKSADEVLEAAATLLRAFQKPLPVDGRELSMSLSIGAACFPAHADSADALLRAADAALFRAKALGRNQVSVFSPELLDAAAARFRTEQGLRLAIERGELELAFQPELEAHSLEVKLVEALLRWRLPDGRLASTADFLAVAEESGLIGEISDWVLRSAIEAAARWHHGPWPQARVAINVSPRQLLDSHFVDQVKSLLEQHRLPATCIEIELTENVLQTGAATIESLRRLRALGTGIALDDFGAGYSSLASLEQLPLTRVKLDRSLISSIDSSARASAIARAIIGLCDSLNLDITAEGIERPEQLALLLGYRNMYLQGYLLSRPVFERELADAMARMPSHMHNVILSLPVTAQDEVIEILAPPAQEIARSA